MDFCLPNPKAKVHPFSSPKSNFLTPFFKISSVQPLDNGKLRRLSKLKCVKESSGSKLEWKIEDEMDMEKELVGMKRLKEKCKGISGIVELLECLEREAIMGEDEGKEPTDYNRRAQIFDKNSRVFQALKERNMSSSTSCM
ncbi:uncharacterized protein [Nicotiana sylvestris]|uniref:Uncharacterized protein LOC104228562 isoform X1 n=1 Tax=Nicotiana sylvestris TaxID=4096 RepID=A0A1U7WPW3_NICSY|nr:PREDICTED: uncharacterized protein LOC104228562 isoform X1 [Nicotiana sylvestris]